MNSFEGILARLKQNFGSRASTLEGTVVGDVLQAVANELARIYSQELVPAQEDLYRNFWDGEDNHLSTTWHGYVGEDRQDMIWDHGIAIFDMYTLYLALEDGSAEKQELYHRFAGEWEHLKNSFTREQMTGNFGVQPNIAIDDTGWGAMVYLIMYQVLGEEECLTLARDCVRNAYDHFKDGEVGNGLWYTAAGGSDPANRFKSMSYVGVLYAALEYTRLSGDDCLMADSLALYHWTEENMLRSGTKNYNNALADGRGITVTADDNLYWMDYNVGRTGRTIVNGPDGALVPDQVAEASSVSCLFANMAMGAIHADLYALTGEQVYLDNALRTVRALNDSDLYSQNGAYVNDRDAWANAMFAGPWVSQVLTLPGVTQADYDRIFITADHILVNARTEDGYYKGGWSGGTAWDAHADPRQIMTTATTVNMLTAAALLERLIRS